MRRDLDAWAWRGIVNVNTTDATTGATDCAEGRDPLHVHVKYLKLLGTRNACSTEQRLASRMKTHTVWVVITVSYFIFTSAAVHTRSTHLERQASSVECGAQPHAAGHAHGDAHEADQAGCARTTGRHRVRCRGTVGARPQRQRRARPASGVPFVTPRDRGAGSIAPRVRRRRAGGLRGVY